jgi:uncharacterized membrane protein YheB (UPF0754 family)
MARKSCDLMVDRLLIVDDIIDRIDGLALFDFLKSAGYIGRIDEDVTNVLLTHISGSKYLPKGIVDRIKSHTSRTSETVCVGVVEALKSKLKDRNFFDVRDLIVSEFVRDKKLLVNLFTQTGRKELLFIEMAGALMGLICGIVQIALWDWFSLSGSNMYVLFGLTGLCIGYITNWVALYVIFNPVDPVHAKAFGRKIFTVQGLFLRRQSEASAVYSGIVTDAVLNPQVVIKYLKERGKWNEVMDLFSAIIQSSVEDAMPSLPFIIQPGVAECVLSQIELSFESQPSLAPAIVAYIKATIQLRETIQSKLESLPSREFEQMLHPVFQEDEFLLIMLGAVLGAAVGVLQVFLFHL